MGKMPKAKKQALTQEERLAQALVPESEQPYEVPENWVWVELGSAVSLSNKKSNQFSSDVKYIGLEHIEKDCGIVSNGSASDVKSSKNVFCAGDILYGKLRPYLNKHGIATFDGICSTDILVFNPTQQCDIHLVNYFLDLDGFIEYAVTNSKGINLPRVSPGVVLSAPLPLPPLPEQRRIVKRIDNLFAKLGHAKELAQSALDSFEDRKAAVLHKAFTGELTAKWRKGNGVGLESWENVPIEQIGKVKGGKRLPKGNSLVNENTGFPYIKAGDLKQGTVLLDKLQYLTPEVQTVIKDYIVRRGDVYITIVGACIGDVGIIPNALDGANLTENAAKITELTCNSRYLGICMGSNIVQSQIKDKIASATLGKLSLQNIRSLSIPLPSLPEQLEIVRILDSLLGKEQRARELCDAIEKIDLMKKAILARAFRGELGTNDPSEESALGLLRESFGK